MKVAELVTDPPAVTTRILPVVAPEGTAKTNSPTVYFETGAGMLPNRT